MAEKMLILTKNDTGVILHLHLTNKYNEKIDISDYTIKFMIKNDAGLEKIEDKYATISNATEGLVRLELPLFATSVEGMCSIYTKISSDSFEVSALKPIYYFVQAENGGE